MNDAGSMDEICGMRQGEDCFLSLERVARQVIKGHWYEKNQQKKF